MGCWMMFGPIISMVEFSGAPVDAEMFLAFSVTEPVEGHVHGFSVLWLDLAIDDAFGSGVVGLKGLGWLFMTSSLRIMRMKTASCAMM